MFTMMLLALAVQTAQPNVSSRDPQTLVRHLQAEGYKAKLTKDRVGDPMIESADGGSNFSIMFYGCNKEHKNCTSVQFGAGWATESEGPSLSIINSWNARYRYTRAYLDKDNDPALEMDLLMPNSRLSAAEFNEALDLFLGSLADFEKHIGWGEDTEAPPASPNVT